MASRARRCLGGLCLLAPGLLACNQLAGIDQPRDRIPAALAAWAPPGADPPARITLVTTIGDTIYVGLSNGDIFLRSRTIEGASWDRLVEGPGCSAHRPRMPVTGIVFSDEAMYIGHAGLRTVSGIWAIPGGGACAKPLEGNDVLAFSPFPLSSAEVLFFSYWNGGWVHEALEPPDNTRPPGPDPSIHFPYDIVAAAEGRSEAGARRVWVGDAAGHLHYTDDADAGVPRESLRWTTVDEERFPAREVVAIGVDTAAPGNVWATFRGAPADSLWFSGDNGRTWTSRYGGALPGDARLDRGAVSSYGPAFSGVSPVPGLGVALVNVLLPQLSEALTVSVSSFWVEGTSNGWSPQ